MTDIVINDYNDEGFLVKESIWQITFDRTRYLKTKYDYGAPIFNFCPEGKFPYYLDTEDVWGADDLLDKYEDLKFSDLIDDEKDKESKFDTHQNALDKLRNNKSNRKRRK